MDHDYTPEFMEWRSHPERSVVAAAVGLILCWLVAGTLVLNMFEIEPGTAAVSGREFLLVMCAPAVGGPALCLSRRVRFWAGSAVPGFAFGWLLGWLPILIVFAVS